jgi:hypothetical protein
MGRTKTTLLLIVAFTALAGWTYADVANGGFETGDFTGWETVGAALVVTSTVGSGPTEGTFEAIILTTGDGMSVFTATPAQTAALTGLSDTDAAAFLAENGVFLQGSALAQDFTANAGDILTFDWNFLTNEERVFVGGDFAFVTITPTGESAELADAITTLLPSSALFFGRETGFQTFSHQLAVGGNYRLGIGILDVVPILSGPPNTHAWDSALLIDNVRLVVPEPASLALFGMGLAGMVGMRIRRRKH